MVYESIDHRNDVNHVVPVVLFLVFRKNKCYCKKQIDHHFNDVKQRLKRHLTNRPQFSMVHTLIDHRNDATKTFKTLQWNHEPQASGFPWVLNILWHHFYGLSTSTSTSTSTLFHKTIGYNRLARKIAIVYKSVDLGKVWSINLLSVFSIFCFTSFGDNHPSPTPRNYMSTLKIATTWMPPFKGTLYLTN